MFWSKDGSLSGIIPAHGGMIHGALMPLRTLMGKACALPPSTTCVKSSTRSQVGQITMTHSERWPAKSTRIWLPRIPSWTTCLPTAAETSISNTRGAATSRITSEPFAEIVETQLANPKAWEHIRRFFPKTAKMFETLIEEASRQ